MTYARVEDLQSSSGSSEIGHCPSGIGAASKSVREALDLIAIYPAGHHYSSDGGKINRIGDRLFVGAAALNDGNAFSAVAGNQDYVSQNIPEGPTTALATMASFSAFGGMGIMGATRSSDSISVGTQGAIGVFGVAINDATGEKKQGAFAGYFEAQQKPGAGYTCAIECDTANQTGAVVQVCPYTSFMESVPDFTANLLFGAGGARAGAANSSAAMIVVGNGAAFEKGLVFFNGSIGPLNEVVSMAKDHKLQWYGPDGHRTGFVQCQAANSAGGIAMTDVGILIGYKPGLVTASIFAGETAGSVNYLAVYPSTTGSPVSLVAEGADANIDIMLAAKGDGLIRFGSQNSAGVGASGSSAPLPAQPVAYLKFKLNVNGVTYQIPFYNIA